MTQTQLAACFGTRDRKQSKLAPLLLKNTTVLWKSYVKSEKEKRIEIEWKPEWNKQRWRVKWRKFYVKWWSKWHQTREWKTERQVKVLVYEEREGLTKKKNEKEMVRKVCKHTNCNLKRGKRDREQTNRVKSDKSLCERAKRTESTQVLLKAKVEKQVHW